MTEARRIAVVTGSRADYGICFWLLKEIATAPDLALQLVVTGAHLSPRYGRTVDAILADGWTIAAEVELAPDDDTNLATAQAVGRGVGSFAQSLHRLRPDVLVVLGDRYETLAAAIAAHLLRIPVAHVHGGEVATGSLDDGMRHAVTKLASLHFVSAEAHRRRVVQMGERPQTVFNVGAPALEHLRHMKLDSREDFTVRTGYGFGAPAFLLTYHPATAADEDPVGTLGAILDALARFPQGTVLATASNADPGGLAVTEQLARSAATFGDRICVVASLGQQAYLSALALSDVVVGNSSSGLIEAPSVGTPTVNVGARQEGRLRAPSVIDCAPDPDAIHAALRKALAPASRRLAAERANPYAAPGLDSAQRMRKILSEIDLAAVARKPFFDLPGDLLGSAAAPRSVAR